MRALRWAAAAAVATVGLAGCGGSAGDATDGATRAVALPRAEPQTVPVDLTFTGLMSGHVTKARTGPNFACGTPTYPDVFILKDLQISLGGRTWAFGITATRYSGPGRMSSQVTVTLSDPKKPSKGYLSNNREATVVVNDDVRSGTADADLFSSLTAAIGGKAEFDRDVRRNNGAGGGQPFHVSGTWRCP